MRLRNLFLGLALLLLSVQSALALTVNVGWTAPTTYENGSAIGSTTLNYNVFRCLKADLSDAVKLGTVMALAYADAGVTAGTTYYYYVVAYVTATLPSKPSAAISITATPPAVPPSQPIIITITVTVP